MMRSDTRPHYHRAMEDVLRQAEVEERSGLPAERVAEAIAHALTARRPREGYLLGSAKTGRVIALLPLHLRERVLRACQQH